jgi:hypothetical protein
MLHAFDSAQNTVPPKFMTQTSHFSSHVHNTQSVRAYNIRRTSSVKENNTDGTDVYDRSPVPSLVIIYELSQNSRRKLTADVQWSFFHWFRWWQMDNSCNGRYLDVTSGAVRKYPSESDITHWTWCPGLVTLLWHGCLSMLNSFWYTTIRTLRHWALNAWSDEQHHPIVNPNSHSPKSITHTIDEVYETGIWYISLTFATTSGTPVFCSETRN